jgi:hypothetical protein
LQHPKKRLDEDLEKQLAELGWYKKELAARVSKEGLTASPGKHCSPSKHKLARERTRELRYALAENFELHCRPREVLLPDLLTFCLPPRRSFQGVQLTGRGSRIRRTRRGTRETRSCPG